MEEEKKFYSPQEVADLLSVSMRLVLRHINSGKLVAANLGSGRRSIYRVSEKDLKNFIENNGREPNPEAR